MINKFTNNRAGTATFPRRSWDKIVQRRASIEKASKTLGYSPKTKIEDGIQRTIKWIAANIVQIDRDARP